MSSFHFPPITPKKIQLGWNIYRACFAAIDEYSTLRRAEATQSWVSTLRHAEVTSRSWEMEARRFREAPDAATLMHTYYRGLPHMLVQALASNDAIDTGDTRWLIAMADEAGNASDGLARAIVENRDVERVHRLQVFPMIAAIQGLSYLPPDEQSTRQELCNRLARLLRDTQMHAPGYSDSACDQINQMLPQILTDQLLAGPQAWGHFYVTDEVLHALMNPILHPDRVRQFETGAAFSIQFLHYYRNSLRGRKLPKWAAQQGASIDAAFASLRGSSDPVQRNLSVLGEQLQSYTAKATRHAEPYKRLIRQTSAAIVADAYKPEHKKMPLPLRQLCIVNSLRAACRSYGLPDETDRLSRIACVLSGHGVTRDIARLAIDNWIESNSADRSKADSFAELLPSTASYPQEAPEMVSAASSMSLDNLLAELTKLNAVQSASKLPPTSGRTVDLYVDMMARIVVQYAYGLDYCGLFKQKRETRDAQIKKVVKQALEEVM